MNIKEIAIFANGCFWCTEATFRMHKGGISIEPGQTGGTIENPTYEQVCGGNTGHAEAIKIEYDPSILSYNDLLAVFFNTHDPTTRKRQGNDACTQYRSAIFYTNPEQKEKAEETIKKLDESKSYDKPVVTEINPFMKFYTVEDYHKNYYENNKHNPYCQIVIAPKVEEMQKRFARLLNNQ